MTGTEKHRNFLLGFIALGLLLFLLQVGQPIIVLIIFALFLAILLQPLASFLDRFLPNWLSIALVVVFIGILLTGIALLFYAQARSVAEKAPEYTERFQSVMDWAVATSEKQGYEFEGLQNSDAVTSVLAMVASGLESIFGFAGKTLLVLIMTIFMLIEAPSLKLKIERAFGDDQSLRVRTSIESMTLQIQRYVTTKTLVSLVTGVLTGCITHALEVDFPVIWGAIAFQLNFIPHVGSMIAVVPPSLLALVQYDSPNTAIATFLILSSVQFSIGNIIEPRIMGQTLELSPVVVFISMMFWGWFWGAAGIMLAVPLTAAVRIVCLHVDSLRPFAVILGNPQAVHESSPSTG
jgi:AI-2 transport protein TqsA